MAISKAFRGTSNQFFMFCLDHRKKCLESYEKDMEYSFAIQRYRALPLNFPFGQLNLFTFLDLQNRYYQGFQISSEFKNKCLHAINSFF